MQVQLSSRTCRATDRIRSGCRAADRGRMICRAQPEQRKVHALVAGLAAATLLAGGMQPLPSWAEPATVPAESALSQGYNEEVAAQDQSQQLSFLMAQQEIVKKAAIAAQRQQLLTQVNQVKATLQAKLIQERANVLGAQKQGNEKAAAASALEADSLIEKQAQVEKAAAQFTTQLDRLEMLEKVRSYAAKQTLQKATTDLESTVNTRLSPLLESVTKMAVP
eukprot:CAMPEP_0119104124 /NCGR_PEP_ID=MMETSP1180-20130426/2418_1 /TAXON_ID=3052 ORGANISM="Chlamydomonas cf sp, Strain CCMP681" /NCGR_SAMPLE_ID=MMETSP1180 /ASSEMBLY_ACC=CAM_ASM_000741 /LENGTH=221 /DNA_ID=CAMNT_0007088803 /DNA_START=64 /DNA_END=729 /DNA_ORIENTATION=-